MNTSRISDAEFQLCLFVWEKEPITSSELVTISARNFGRARTTTHTFIRRFVDRGVLKNDRGIVTSLVSKEAAQEAALSELIKTRFNNSARELVTLLERQKLIKTEWPAGTITR